LAIDVLFHHNYVINDNTIKVKTRLVLIHHLFISFELSLLFLVGKQTQPINHEYVTLSA